MQKRGIVIVRAALEQVKMVQEESAPSKSRKVHCSLQESSYNDKDKTRLFWSLR